MRRRMTQTQQEVFDSGLCTVVADAAPCTARQAFYRGTVVGLLPKLEREYRRLVKRLGVLRLDGRIPWHAIVDATRWFRKPETFDGWTDAVAQTRRAYRQSVWSGLPDRVLVLIEKDALVGSIYNVTAEFDVELLSCRGFCSLSLKRQTAHQITAAWRGAGACTHMLALGDGDPSGVMAHREFERRMREWCPAGSFTFDRLAVTQRQVTAWQLPEHPTKVSTHARATGWQGGSVELDAIDPGQLRQLLRAAIKRYIPDGHMRAIEIAEASEKALLKALKPR